MLFTTIKHLLLNNNCKTFKVLWSDACIGTAYFLNLLRRSGWDGLLLTNTVVVLLHYSTPNVVVKNVLFLKTVWTYSEILKTNYILIRGTSRAIRRATGTRIDCRQTSVMDPLKTTVQRKNYLNKHQRRPNELYILFIYLFLFFFFVKSNQHDTV